MAQPERGTRIAGLEDLPPWQSHLAFSRELLTDALAEDYGDDVEGWAQRVQMRIANFAVNAKAFSTYIPDHVIVKTESNSNLVYFTKNGQMRRLSDREANRRKHLLFRRPSEKAGELVSPIEWVIDEGIRGALLEALDFREIPDPAAATIEF